MNCNNFIYQTRQPARSPSLRLLRSRTTRSPSRPRWWVVFWSSSTSGRPSYPRRARAQSRSLLAGLPAPATGDRHQAGQSPTTRHRCFPGTSPLTVVNGGVQTHRRPPAPCCSLSVLLELGPLPCGTRGSDEEQRYPTQSQCMAPRDGARPICNPGDLQIFQS